MRYAVFVTGPAGAGKSTFCSALISHAQTMKRTIHYVNLDPAATNFDYQPAVDIKDLINLEDVMEELEFGPNGGLVYCFEYLLNNLDWLDEELGSFEDDYLLIDCPGKSPRFVYRSRAPYDPVLIYLSLYCMPFPLRLSSLALTGQIELYTHIPLLPRLLSHLQSGNLQFRISAVYLLESQFAQADKAKFFAGVMSAMSCMLSLGCGMLCLMSKMDLIKGPAGGTGKGPQGRKKIGKEIGRYLDTDTTLLLEDANKQTNPRFHALNQAIVNLIEDHSIVSFLPLDITNEDSLTSVLSHIDHTMQYGEDEEPKAPEDLDGGDFGGDGDAE